MGQQRKGANAACPTQPMYADNFLVGDVKFDIANPEAQPTVGGDVNAPDRIVPKPCHREEIADGDGNYCAMGAKGHGRDEDSDECGF